MLKIIKNLTILGLMAILFACDKSTSYQDVSQNKLSSSFSVSDQKILVDDLTKKLLSDTYIKTEIGNKPTLIIDTIKNKTSEQIDTESITDTLKVNIVRSRLFTIINRDKTNILLKEQEINQSGLTDKQRAAQLGRLWGAKYALYGNFSSIVNYAGGQKQTYYKFALVIQDIETGEEIWIEESDLNKITK